MKDKTMSRRNFMELAVKGGTLLGGVSAAGDAQCGIINNSRPDAPYTLNEPENIIYTSCLNCNTGCGIKVKVQDSVAVKIDGNPYNPFSLVPNLPMTTSIYDAARIDSAICPKGQAGIQNLYDPYRIASVLKRAGKRGENKWVTIPFDKAIKEIVEGGKLFAHVPGEENRQVEGLRSIGACRDNSLMKAMGEDIKTLWKEKDAEKKKELTAAFKEQYKESLHMLIDPEHPDLGPKNNQFIIAFGRLKNGRKEFLSRLADGFGTVNLHGHTTVCQGSLYFTCKAISEQYKHGKFTDGKKFYWQADLESSKYILFVGANLFEANYGPTNRTVRLIKNLSDGTTTFAVVDPRYTKLAGKAQMWIAIKPGEDAAMALAIIQWMIGNERIDKNFLQCANKAAAKAAKETSWTNASWLVEVKDGKPGKFLRASDIGLAQAQKCSVPDEKDPAKTIEYEEKFFAVMENGVLKAFEPNDEDNPVVGDLFVDTEIESKDGSSKVHVKSSLQILKESALEHSFDDWCKIAGINPKDVVHVAKELTSYGKQAAVDIHRGPAQHTNGFYNVLAWMSINMLLGNFDYKGGISKASTYGYDATKDGPFKIGKISGKMAAFGISSIRHNLEYEHTTLFKGYPAKRNWYPLSSDVYEEIIPSIGDAYPYSIKALFLYMGTPAYSLPAGQTNIDVLADVNKLPLFFTSDICIGTTSLYSDYIFPDLTYLERWEFHGSHPNMINKVEPIRQPSVAPFTETVKVFNTETPLCLESLTMAIGELLGLKSFGKGAIDGNFDLTHMDDLYLRAVTNTAVVGKPVPDASEDEIEIFKKARRHIPKHVFDYQRWKNIAGDDLWPNVVFILNRGGRFEDHSKGYDGDKLAHRYGALINMYQEKTATKKYSGTGKSFPGIARYIPQRNYIGESLEGYEKGYDLHLITHRVVMHTKSRTASSYWLLALMPENAIVINTSDAQRLGLSDGEYVMVVSATNTKGGWDLKNGVTKDIVGKISVTEAIRPGVISFALGFGNWATGGSDCVIDGKLIKGDKARTAGIHANALMWTDPSVRNNTCLFDPVGGSVSFYDTKVKLIKYKKQHK
ncbi:MAG: molybdopterin-dependent oxidoreductase [Candidatus Magnetobacterium sp. LHC-1]